MSVYLFPYKLASRSARALSQKLNIPIVNGRKTFKRGTTIISWGKTPTAAKSRFPLVILNKQDAVLIARNKLTTFQKLKSSGVSTVEWTTDPSVASSWLRDGFNVYARHDLCGSSGRGIQVLTEGVDFCSAPLYTKGFNKSHEYRVHVFRNQVIDFSKKKKRNGVNSDCLVKNLNNGWVFCRDNVVLPIAVQAVALQALYYLGLDFGAMDILYKETTGQAKLLEVNTAPGLQGKTLDCYVKKIKEIV